MWPIFRLPCFVMSMCAARQRELEAAAPAATPFSQAACVPGGVCLGPWHAGALLGAWLCVIVIGVAEPLVFGISCAAPSAHRSHNLGKLITPQRELIRLELGRKAVC